MDSSGKRYWLAIGFLVVCFMMFPAKNALSTGKLVFKPSIESGCQYDSNFFKAETRERPVMTYHLKPGLEFGLTTSRTRLLAYYFLDARWYEEIDEDKLNPGEPKADDYDYVDHRGEVSAETRLSKHFLIGLENRYLRTRDPGNSDIFSNAVERYRYHMNRLTPKVVYHFGDRGGLSLKYTSLITDYDLDLLEDSNENRGALALFYLPVRRTALTLNLQYWTRDYERQTPDYKSRQVMLNVSRSGKYLELMAGAGFHDRNFDDVTVEDMDAFVWTVGLTARNQAEADSRPKSSLTLSAGRNFNDAGGGHTYFKATQLFLGGTWLIFDKVNLSADGSYQRSDYQTMIREDDTYRASFGIDYYLNKYVTLGLKSGYEERASSLEGKNYENSYVLAKASVHYDMGSR